MKGREASCFEVIQTTPPPHDLVQKKKKKKTVVGLHTYGMLGCEPAETIVGIVHRKAHDSCSMIETIFLLLSE